MNEYTSNNFSAWLQKWERGYFDSIEKIDHPTTIARAAARERELRLALVADGVPAEQVEDVIAWADAKARMWEIGARERRNPSPMVTGYELTLVFILRLLRGIEQMD